MRNIPTFDEILTIIPERLLGIMQDCEQTPQSPKWHPEGDVLIHTRIVYNRAVNHGDWDLVLAALFHDTGKVQATRKNAKGNWSAYGHEFISAGVVDTFKDWIEEVDGDFDRIREVVKLHMKIKYIDEMRDHKRKQLQENPVYDDLIIFTEFDNMSTLTPEELK